jgi:flagellar biosynthesis protein FlhG
MGAALARAGKSVVVVDANVAAPNLHAFLGIRVPGCTLLDVLDGRAVLTDALTATSESFMRCLTCVGDGLGMAELPPAAQQRMAERIASLDADHVLIDCGSGAWFSVLDFFNLGDEALVVASPDPASMQCSYGFVKNSIYRRIQKRWGSRPEVESALRQMHQGTNNEKPRTMADFVDTLRQTVPDLTESIAAMVDSWHPLMVINMATAEQDQRVAEIVLSASRKFLNVEMEFRGMIPSDAEALRSVQRTSLLDVVAADSAALLQAGRIALRIAGEPSAETATDRRDHASQVSAGGAAGLNDNLTVMGKDLHVQTEDLGETGCAIQTQVFCEGRVVLSTRSEYPPALRLPCNGIQVVELMRAQHFHVIREIENRKAGLKSA